MIHFSPYLLVLLATASVAMQDAGPFVAIGQSHLLIISNNNEVRSFGSGECGQLGHGNQNSICGWGAKPQTIESFKAKTPKSVAAGLGFSLVLFDDGTVHSFGKGHFGQLGTDKKPDDNTFFPGRLLPEEITLLKSKHILQIAAGTHHALALDSEGKVYYWGDDQYEPEEIKILAEKNIKKIVAGNQVSFAIDKDGNLWSFACMIRYAGEPVWEGNYYLPRIVNDMAEMDGPVKSVAAGKTHVVILSKSGSIFSFGANKYCQLGHSDRIDCSLPGKVAGLDQKDIVKVVAGENFSAALSSSGELWWWGTLNIEDSWTDYCSPQPIKFHKNKNQSITDIVAGPLCNTLGVIIKGTLFLFGGSADCSSLQSFQKYFFNQFEGISPGKWCKENHKLQGKQIREAVFIMMVLNKFDFDPVILEDILYVIFGHLT